MKTCEITSVNLFPAGFIHLKPPGTTAPVQTKLRTSAAAASTAAGASVSCAALALCSNVPVESPLRTQFTRIKIQTKLLENFLKKFQEIIDKKKFVRFSWNTSGKFFSNVEFSLIQ